MKNTFFRKTFAALALASLLTLGSCSIFRGGCNCPKFGDNQQVKPAPVVTAALPSAEKPQ